MSDAARRRWIIGVNTLLILLYVYGFYSEITFGNPLEEYLGRTPMPLVLAQIIQEKAWSVAASILLILGLGAEFRRKRAGVFINTAAYGLMVAIFIWDCASLAGHPEHLFPYVLGGVIPSVLIPGLALTLYGREIVSLAKAR